MRKHIDDITFNKLLEYNWDAYDIYDIVTSEFKWLYGNYDSVKIVEITNEHVKFVFHNTFAKDIALQIDNNGNITEVNL